MRGVVGGSCWRCEVGGGGGSRGRGEVGGESGRGEVGGEVRWHSHGSIEHKHPTSHQGRMDFAVERVKAHGGESVAERWTFNDSNCDISTVK